MEDLIPFLIIMLISVVGAIGSRKKRREQTDVPQAPGRQLHDDEMPEWFKRFIPTEEEDLLSHQGSYETQVSHEVKPVAEQAPAAPVKPGIFDRFSGFISPDEREKLMKKEGERTISQKIQAIKNHPKPQNTGNQALSIPKFNFNLKQAVINSEILNRKYQ
jgi:hypothetical protein